MKAACQLIQDHKGIVAGISFKLFKCLKIAFGSLNIQIYGIRKRVLQKYYQTLFWKFKWPCTQFYQIYLTQPGGARIWQNWEETGGFANSLELKKKKQLL